MTHVPSFYVKQKITMMVNRYEILERNPDGSEGRLLAFAQQKRMSFKEKVLFFADESRSQELFSFKARQGLDVRAEHDVFDSEGNAIGWFKKDFIDAQGTVVMSSERKAKIRDYYTITVPDERLDFRVAASMAVALDALQSR